MYKLLDRTVGVKKSVKYSVSSMTVAIRNLTGSLGSKTKVSLIPEVVNAENYMIFL